MFHISLRVEQFTSKIGTNRNEGLAVKEAMIADQMGLRSSRGNYQQSKLLTIMTKRPI